MLTISQAYAGYSRSAFIIGSILRFPQLSQTTRSMAKKGCAAVRSLSNLKNTSLSFSDFGVLRIIYLSMHCSSGANTAKPSPIKSCFPVSGTVQKMTCSHGRDSAAKITATDTITASISFLLFPYGTVNIFFRSDLHSNTWKSWDITSVNKAAVRAAETLPVRIFTAVKLPNVHKPISTPRKIIFCMRPSEKKLSSDLRGGFFMFSFSGGSTPSATAGSPSVTRFTRSI